MRPILFYLPLNWLGLPPAPVFGFGLMLVIAFLAAASLAWRRAPRYGIDPGQAIDLALYAIVSGLVGARLAFLIWDYEARPDSASPFLDMLAVWNGGLTFQGGLVMALAVTAWYLSNKGIGAGRAMDVFAPSVALGAGIGRFGCFLNSCCWGHLAGPDGGGVVFAAGSDVARWQEYLSHDASGWARKLQEAGYVPGAMPPPGQFPLPVVPTQLYECFALITLAAALLAADRLWTRRPAGMLMVLCLGAYSFFRFFVEYARDDTPLLYGFGPFEGLKLGQWLALATGSVCVPLAAMLFLKGETIDLTRGPLRPAAPKRVDAPSAAPAAPSIAAAADPTPKASLFSGRAANDPWAHPAAKPPPKSDNADAKPLWHEGGGPRDMDP